MIFLNSASFAAALVFYLPGVNHVAVNDATMSLVKQKIVVTKILLLSIATILPYVTTGCSVYLARIAPKLLYDQEINMGHPVCSA